MKEPCMTKSYSQIQKKIDALKAKADSLRLKEAGGVIARIKEAIAHYGLTMTDVFGDKSSSRGRGASRRTEGAARRDAKYADGKGNVWGGRGPRPKWLRDALGRGKRLEDFDVKSAPASDSPAAPRKASAAKKRRKSAVKYRDDAGNTWTGRGRKPRWFQDAVAAGKKPEDMAAN
jgi:DNA-binding protein H-NS